jgi:hypothetical protein
MGRQGEVAHSNSEREVKEMVKQLIAKSRLNAWKAIAVVIAALIFVSAQGAAYADVPRVSVKDKPHNGLYYLKSNDGETSILGPANSNVKSVKIPATLKGKKVIEVIIDAYKYSKKEIAEIRKWGQKPTPALNLSNLDLNSAKHLEWLDILGGRKYDKLKALDLRNNKKLKTVYITSSKLATLKLPKNSKIEYLTLSECKIKSLDTSNLKRVTDLSLPNTKLKRLDTSKLSKLTSLNIEGIKGLKVDLSKNKKIQSVSYSPKKLSKTVYVRKGDEGWPQDSVFVNAKK